MAYRAPVSKAFNHFYDSQKISERHLSLDQQKHIETDGAIVFNHFGNGAIIKSLNPNIIFNSENLNQDQAALLAAQKLDGIGLEPHSQPSDTLLGNQLTVALSNSSVFGRFSTKVAIIGLDFNGELQVEKLIFNKNRKFVTSKHYTKIISILLNDFKGNNNCSRNWGGQIIISEAESFELSLDPIMICQDSEPDIFWRDFKVADPDLTLEQTLQNALGAEYTVDALNIRTTGQEPKKLNQDDAVSHIGQKFVAITDNIQKISLLLGCTKDNNKSEENWYDWSGELIFSVYKLQSNISCPSDIVPNLAIEYDPEFQTVAQIVVSQKYLKETGYVLTDILQPVDFVLSTADIAKAGALTPGDYYAFSLKRTGDTTVGDLLIGCGLNNNKKTRVTLFNSSWIDLPDESLWFQIWTDSIKISDGLGYENGKGIQFDKTIIDPESGAIIDHQIKNLPFLSTGEGVQNIGILKAVQFFFQSQQNEKSGLPVNSLQQFVPKFDFLSEIDFSEYQKLSDTFALGVAQDNNPKDNPATIGGYQIYPGLSKGDTFYVINPSSDLLAFNLIGSKLIPNNDCKSKEYRIFNSMLCTALYGDLNGDGEIDIEDLSKISTLVGESFYLSSTQLKIINGEISALELLKADLDGDGYISSEDVNLLNSFVNKQSTSFPTGSSFNYLALQVQSSIGRYDGYFDCGNLIRLDGYVGVNLVNPSDLSLYELEYDGYIGAIYLESDSQFTTVPFSPVPFQIVAQPFWQDYLVNIDSDVKKVPVTFSDNFSAEKNCENFIDLCQDLSVKKNDFQSGKNNFYIPGNIYLDGEILNKNESHYKVDVELGIIILQLPAQSLSEIKINIFDKFVYDVGNGKNAFGTSAMRYADCSLVRQEDLLLNKIKFGASIQSYYPNLDGYSEIDGGGIIVDPIFAMYLDQSTGILTLTAKDIDLDPILYSLITKVQVIVYLKKAGWNNELITVTPSQLLNII